MKLIGTCQRCDRELLLDQLLDTETGARCPWCGAGMAGHYNAILHRVIPEIERAGRDLTRGLKVLRGDWTGFDLDERSVLGPIVRALGGGDIEDSPAARGESSSSERARAA